MRLPQPFAHQGLVGFGKPDFPGRAGVLDRGQGTPGPPRSLRWLTWSARALATTGGDRADADFGDQLHADTNPSGLTFLRS